MKSEFQSAFDRNHIGKKSEVKFHPHHIDELFNFISMKTKTRQLANREKRFKLAIYKEPRIKRKKRLKQYRKRELELLKEGSRKISRLTRQELEKAPGKRVNYGTVFKRLKKEHNICTGFPCSI